jgi:hypothetical protein
MFSFKVLSWVALIATLCFIALVVLQVLEMNFYANPPSVW